MPLQVRIRDWVSASFSAEASGAAALSIFSVLRCRTTLLRLCPLRVEPGAAAPAAQGTGRSLVQGRAMIATPLAIRAGVDPGATEGGPAGGLGDQQPQRQRHTKEKRPPQPHPNHFLALQVCVVTCGRHDAPMHSPDQLRRHQTRLPFYNSPPPRAWLCLQVSQHPDVVAAIQRVHASLAGHSPHLQKACVEAVTAHLTLGVLALGSEEERRRACEAMAGLAAALAEQALLSPVEVHLEGLSHFRNQVGAGRGGALVPHGHLA